LHSSPSKTQNDLTLVNSKLEIPLRKPLDPELQRNKIEALQNYNREKMHRVQENKIKQIQEREAVKEKERKKW